MYLAVCDDQADELNVLISLIGRWQRERRAAMRYRAFDNADELLKTAAGESFSLYLLDVIMPGVDGIAAAREIRGFDEAADIVFLTSSPDFAYQSYGVKAMDYLLKPVGADKLFPILDRLLLREQKPQEGLTLKCGTSLIRVPFSNLDYLEVSGKHLYFNLTDGSVREVFGTLKEFEPVLLERPEFIRVHRSYIVNLFQAAELSSAGIRTFSGKTIPVSRLLYSQVQKNYLNLLFAKEE